VLSKHSYSIHVKYTHTMVPI